MTVPELSLGAWRARPAHRSAVPAPSPTWLDTAAPLSDATVAVDHTAPAHAGAAHHTPAAPFTARVGVDIAAMVVRGAIVGAFIALIWVAITDGWVAGATDALSTWWADDIAPYFALDVTVTDVDGGGSGTLPAARG